VGAIKETGAGTLEITYGGLESPFVGIDAKKASQTFITPNALAMSSGVGVTDGYLSSMFLNPQGPVLNLGPLSYVPSYCVGSVQVNTVTTGPPNTVTKVNYGFIAVSFSGSLNIYEYRNGLTTGYTSIISVSASLATNLSFYVINGVVYITGLGLAAIYTYTPVPSGTSTLTQLTNYVGGAYLGELNGRLLCLCCDQIVSGVYSYYPYQISWSGAAGAYGIWNPLSSGLVTGAGYNNLPDVKDEIVGFFSTGPTGYIIRKQGVTEMTPLNSGIQPFDFNHLWASNTGIGSIYPSTVNQYGSLGAFLSDTGVYTMGYSGVNTIQGNIWSLIVKSLQIFFGSLDTPVLNTQISYVAGALVPISIGGEEALYYVLYLPGVTNNDSYLFVGNVLTQDWFLIPAFAYAGGANYNTFKPSIQGISRAAFNGVGIDNTIACVSALFETSSGYTITLYTIDDTSILPTGIPYVFPGTTALSVYFPVEEISMFKDITVDAIGFYLDVSTVSNDAVIVTPGVNSTTFQPIRVQNGQGQFFMSYGINGPFTGKYPQLSLEIATDVLNSSNIRIYKIVMFASYDKGQRP
jgi:hypothetical protein